VRVGWSLALFAAAFDANACAAQTGLTLQEALNLPSAELAVRVLGQVGQRYSEVERPYLGGVPGRVGFSLEFASAPRPAGFPGLCEADILSVSFWPASPASSPDEAMHVHSIYTSTRYKNVDDTTPLTGWSEVYERHLAALCDHSGPVLNQPGQRATTSHFFGGGYAQSGTFWPVHAYFAVRGLQKAMTAARTGSLVEISCQGETTAMTAILCANPRQLLSGLNLARLNGFSISSCQEGVPQLCVEAGFSPNDDPDSHLVLTIRMRTDLTRLDGGSPPDFNLVSVQIRESSFVN
jgi:hypothetical protein